MEYQQQQPAAERMRERSLEEVQMVEQKVKPYEELFIKCKDDWIHHLAQALAFSSLMAFVPNSILVFAVSDLILGKMDSQTWHVLIGGLLANTPSPLLSPLTQILGNAYNTLAHTSVIAVLFTIVLAVLLGSFFFSLMETCFDVIYHLPPRPFLRRHLVSIGLLLLFSVLTPIHVMISLAPTYLLSFIYVVPSGTLPESNLIFRLAGIVGSTIISLFLFEAIYAMIAHRHITFRTLGRHMRNSWRGALIATVAMQLFLQLFPIYAARFLGSYIGEIGFVLILLFFIYVSTLLLLFGAEVNAFFAEGIRVPKNDLITRASQDERR